MLRHAQECSPSAQVKAAAAHVQTLKQNQRKKKVEYDLYGSLGLLDLAAALHYSHVIGAFLRKITEDPNQNISQTGSSGLNVEWDRDFRKFIQFGKYLVMKA